MSKHIGVSRDHHRCFERAIQRLLHDIGGCLTQHMLLALGQSKVCLAGEQGHFTAAGPVIYYIVMIYYKDSRT